MSTLYTREELQDWEQFSSFPAVQRSRTQKILNSLCVEGKCSSAGGNQVYEKFDLSELTSRAEANWERNPCQNKSAQIC